MPGLFGPGTPLCVTLPGSTVGVMNDPFYRAVFANPYRYEAMLIGATLVTALWPAYAGEQGFVAGLAIILLVLDARSASQLKRQTEDLTMLDRFLSRIPLRYEALIVLCSALALLWWLAAGTTGAMFGLGLVVLALRARSSSQLKRGAAVTIHEA